MTQVNTNQPSMSKKEMFGWAIGSHGAQAMIGIYAIYLLFFLTNVLGIGALIAGQIIFIVRLYDLVTDPLLGHISDRTVSARGRRRPYLLVGAFGCTLSVVLLFNLSPQDSQTMTAVTAMAVLLVYATMYTIFNVPHLAMPAEMTSSYHERTTLMSIRVIFFSTATVTVALGGSILIDRFGEEQGFPLLGWLIASTMLVSMLACYYMTRTVRFVERTEGTSYTFAEQMRIIGRNKPFLILIGAKIGLLTAQASQVAAFLFFSEYILEGSIRDSYAS